jgi:hypothetical protein
MMILSLEDCRQTGIESTTRDLLCLQLGYADVTSLFLFKSSRFKQMSHETVNGLLSSSVEEANIPPTRRAFARIVQYSAKNWSIILLVFVPAGVLARRLGYSDGIVFILNCLAILALTDWLCQATDSVSSYLGETAGALLNVTMGNATEVVIL